MPLNAGAEAGYGSVPGAGLPGGEGASETDPLLAPDSVYEWQPMNKQQLQAAAGGSGWKAVRCYLVLLFWLAWIAMLAVAVAIVVVSPKPVPTSLRWWQKCLFYHIKLEMSSDLQAERSEGINEACERLPYLRSLGVGALILQGAFHENSSPENLTENLETKAQVQHLLAESKKSDLRVVLDICEVNLPGRSEMFRNLNTSSNCSATDVLRFWLDEGVAGFVICDTDSAYSVETLLEWRGVFEEFSTPQDERILLLRQTLDVLHPLNVSTQSNGTLVDVVLKTILPKSQQPLSSEEVAEAIETKLQTWQDDVWISWTVGGEVSDELKRLVLVLMMTLPGSPAFKYKEMEQTLDEKHSDVALFSTLSHSKSREEALLFGSLSFLPFNTTTNFSSSSLSNSSVSSPPILAFLRSWGCVQFLVLLNVWPEPQSLDPSWAASLPEKGVYVASTGMNHMGSTSLYSVKLLPYEALVIKLFRPGGYS
ncbi:PREDICTED: 4F2 cell-surface antigen heavy chain-like [Cyprinodon variegatus]|uniref:4F2 cell-surface antigen heavy chain-like n=1 Tax=Cyprinodon variegatus TaxID=28743 RepID=UPI000742BB5E|nr:PREDICTED: 4F2 cell-surface antigen heavy chain-like [Cyprinodon variegatus]